MSVSYVALHITLLNLGSMQCAGIHVHTHTHMHPSQCSDRMDGTWRMGGFCHDTDTLISTPCVLAMPQCQCNSTSFKRLLGSR
ncbi:hypothetical protein COO60DRAFT_1473073 [Scenedesmus sp. NREL 46B-D3]|nr:hypothetical protein COO60DRAFT_1473073 [Scenedesmus sp. NREL 46B-D3]